MSVISACVYLCEYVWCHICFQPSYSFTINCFLSLHSHGVMFWSNTDEDVIYQANLDGTDIRVLLNGSLEVVGE